MGFYYATERKRFEREWDKLRKDYEAAGMSQEAIQLLYEFDLECFRSQRTYEIHTQALPSEYINGEKIENSVLLRKFASSTISFDEADFSGRYAWVDTIENQRLVCALRQLSIEDLELLTFLVIEEHTQRELAEKLGCTQEAVSKRFIRIKKFLK
ncbi:sigma-70 family RNA polymerase sigma factor [Pseudoflavonifractor sp. 60]|nr:sigma-70 family RNA polymerase sigma factor [Pseudoflavonifractor sp. 60]